MGEPIDISASVPSHSRQPYGTILAINCIGPSCEDVPVGGVVLTIGLPEHITYRIAVNGEAGPMLFDDVVPAHRRSNVKVIAAQPGDKVPVIWEGYSVYFIVIEPPYFDQCEEK
jgi:hypothetical protein